MTSATDICNLALDLLKEAPITSLSQDRPIARWMNRNFAVTRDSVLSKADWNCAIKRTTLPADGTAPEFGWTYRYQRPSDCLRIIPLTYDGYPEGTPIKHKIEGNYILTDQSGPLKVRYVSRFEEYDSYPAPLIEAISAALAGKAAHWLTGKSNYVQIARQSYKDAMDDAWLVDAIEGLPDEAADNEWVAAR